MKKIFAIAVLLLAALSLYAIPIFALAATSPLPNDATKLLPQVTSEIQRGWPELNPREFVPALIEQESFFKLGAKLQTSREFGCGLGQFTKAYNADGSVRFDSLEETKRLDPSLSEWSWRDCYNATFQIRAVVLKLRGHERSCSAYMIDSINAKACAAAQYNGGAGSVNKRIRACRLDANCRPDIWAGNLDTKCPQSRTKVAGYGEDFCTINSKYPSRVFARMPKYQGRV